MLKEDKTVMLLRTDTRDQAWIDAFSVTMPELEVRLWPETGDRSEINCALLWGPPPELFDELDNLEVIFSIGAGVDSLLTCQTLPAHLPIVRMVESELTAGMVEFCLFHVLRFHRLMHLFEKHRVERRWEDLTQVPASEVTVGIMGIGVLGQALARQLSALQAMATGSEIARQRSVRTGWMNLMLLNIATVSATMMARITVQCGLTANRTRTTMFQHPGKPAKE